MSSEERVFQGCQDGVPVSDLIKKTSIKFINGLRENGLICINRKGRIKLTSKGKVARKMGLYNYLDLDENERSFLKKDVSEMESENVGFMMILGGLLLSFLFLVGYWYLYI